jgi:hypothetical protein
VEAFFAHLETFLTSVGSHQTAIMVIATAVIAIASLATFFVTLMLARENRLLRKAGTEPQVVAYLLPDDRHTTTLNFVLSNIGQGPARNVSYTFDADMADFAKHNARLMNSDERPAISVLPQGERFVAYFGVGHQLFAGEGLKPFTVNVSYENIKGKSTKKDFPLDIAQYLDVVTLGTPAEHEVAEAMKKLAKTVEYWTSGSRRLKVETITTQEAEARLEEFREQRRQKRAKRQEQQPGPENQVGVEGTDDTARQ